jgi:hypothetical protein
MTAGVGITNVGARTNTPLPQNVAPRKTAENDGRTPRISAPTVLGSTKGGKVGTGSPLVTGTDRARATAKAPTSTGNGDFVAIGDIAGVGLLRPGEVEHLAGHGISVGVHQGVLKVSRTYVPTVAGLIAQARGVR